MATAQVLEPYTPTYRSASLAALTGLRAFFVILTLLFLDATHDLGTSLFWLSCAAIVGCSLGTTLPKQKTPRLNLILWIVLPYILFRTILFLDTVFFVHEKVLFPHALLLHFNICYMIFIATLLSTWLFWRYAITTSLELVAAAAAVVWLLSGHRNYNLIDIPLVIGNLAWELGTDIPSLLIIFSIIAIVTLWAYLILATSPARPLYNSQKEQLTYYNQSVRSTAIALTLLFTLVVLASVSRYVLYSYTVQLAERGSNGVGMAAESEDEAIGNSPLGFHSALGSNNQPAAVVRLEGDYIQNPFSPMLYLREGALSAFNGREMVQAERELDTDIPHTSADEEYIGEEDVQLLRRTPVVQSIYLLAEHKEAFALDYPVSITPLKNPSPKRFRGSYKVYSIAPAFNLPDLNLLEHSDPRWSQETLKHYLEPHPDTRYNDLALEITDGLYAPAEKARAITEFLSKNAIYTLSPEHEVGEDEDPVAPFLFGDMRGYCVHFAHATVYMLRSLGIPARVATGYLTDLSQSKDGHILLRMSDRHAWAEIYIRDRGWIPFDTQPDQVESHADTQVDMNLLEELMGLIGPDEELFSDDLLDNEEGVTDPPADYALHIQYLLWILGAGVLSLYLIKLYVRYGDLLYSDGNRKLAASYRKTLSLLYDIGYERYDGETRKEFQQRVAKIASPSLLEMITKWYNQTKYGGKSLQLDSIVAETRKDTTAIIESMSWRARIISILNPASAVAFLFGERW